MGTFATRIGLIHIGMGCAVIEKLCIRAVDGKDSGIQYACLVLIAGLFILQAYVVLQALAYFASFFDGLILLVPTTVGSVVNATYCSGGR